MPWSVPKHTGRSQYYSSAWCAQAHSHTHMFCGVRTCHRHHIKWKGRGSSARARFSGPLLHAAWRDTFKVKRRKLSEVQRAQAGR